MSLQSNLFLETSNSPIWQNQDLGPNSTTILFLNNTFNLDDNLDDLIKRLVEIGEETQCIITIHGQWIKIKNNSSAVRKHAFKLVNSATQNCCKEIFLPSVGEESSLNGRLSSPSPPPTPKNESTKSTAQNKPVVPSVLDSPKRKSGLTRSMTETQISSLQMSKTNSPFSVLLPLTPKTQLSSPSKLSNSPLLEEVDASIISATDINNNTINNTEPKKETKLRYSKDVLLLRSDVPSSKKLPTNWKDLNELFPSICFCGKVLSYFNPYKYHEHWEKTKKQNYELHYSTESPRFEYHKGNIDNPHLKAHTDDYLNLNGNFYNPHKTRNSDFQKGQHPLQHSTHNYHNGMGHKKHQLSFDMRQNQFQQNKAYYYQENQMLKRTNKQRMHFNAQKVFE